MEPPNDYDDYGDEDDNESMAVEDRQIRILLHENRETRPDEAPHIDVSLSLLRVYFPLIYELAFAGGGGDDQATTRTSLTLHLHRQGLTARQFKRLIHIARLYAAAAAETTNQPVDPMIWYDEATDDDYPSLLFTDNARTELMPLLLATQRYGFDQAYQALATLLKRYYASQHHFERIVKAATIAADFQDNQRWLDATPALFYNPCYLPYVGELRTIEHELKDVGAALVYTILHEYLNRRMGKSGRLCRGSGATLPCYVLGTNSLYLVLIPETGDEEAQVVQVDNAPTGQSRLGSEQTILSLSSAGDVLATLTADGPLERGNYVMSRARYAQSTTPTDIRLYRVSPELLFAATSEQYLILAGPDGHPVRCLDTETNSEKIDASQYRPVAPLHLCALDTYRHSIMALDKRTAPQQNFYSMYFVDDEPHHNWDEYAKVVDEERVAILVGTGRNYDAYVSQSGQLYVKGTLDDREFPEGVRWKMPENTVKLPEYATFTRIEHRGRISALSCGANHLMVRSSLGLYGMGLNESGQLATGNRRQTDVLIRIDQPGRLIDFSCGEEFSVLHTAIGIYYTSQQTLKWQQAAADFVDLPEGPTLPSRLSVQKQQRATTTTTTTDEEQNKRKKMSSTVAEVTTLQDLSSCHQCGAYRRGGASMKEWHGKRMRLYFCSDACQTRSAIHTLVSKD